MASWLRDERSLAAWAWLPEMAVKVIRTDDARGPGTNRAGRDRDRRGDRRGHSLTGIEMTEALLEMRKHEMEME